MNTIVNAGTYDFFLNLIRKTFDTVKYRIIVVLPDGTVVLDTRFLPGNPRNSYQSFINKTVNENHNSRISIFTAQFTKCGVGYETKISTSVGDREIYVAARLGQWLNSAGTIRISEVTQ